MLNVCVDDVRPEIPKKGIEYFPSDKTDRRIEWKQENPGYGLYEPRSAACQLGISLSYFRYSVRNDATTPVVAG